MQRVRLLILLVIRIVAMNNRNIKNLSLLFFGFVSLAHATELSSGLVKEDVRKASKKLAWGSAHRNWTATDEESDRPLGLSVGIEAAFIPRGKLLKMGDGAGVVPSVIPVPRAWMSWALPQDFFVSFDAAPGKLFDGITTYGSALQWTFLRDQATFSAIASYTYSNAFGDLTSHTVEAAAQVAKSLELWQPYVGLGLMNSYSKASSRRIAPGNKRGYFEVLAVHGYLGFMTHVPARVGAQLDFMNTQPSLAFLLAQEF